MQFTKRTMLLLCDATRAHSHVHIYKKKKKHVRRVISVVQRRMHVCQKRDKGVCADR